jgi:hypothetical protein
MIAFLERYSEKTKKEGDKLNWKRLSSRKVVLRREELKRKARGKQIRMSCD